MSKEGDECLIRFRHLDDVIENDVMEKRRAELEAPLRYRHLKNGQFEVVDKLLRGGLALDKLPNLRPKVVRMFVCSTGPDFEAERSYLLENVYPLLRDYCRDSYGLDFQMVDMLWGVADDTVSQPEYLDTVARELRHCQEVSIGPTFVAFIGQKYGTVYLPTEVASSELDAIKTALEEKGRDTQLIDRLYKEDHNVATSICRLHIPHQTAGCNNKTLDQSQSDVLSLLVSGVEDCIQRGNLPPSALLKYTISGFAKELRRGLIDLPRQERDKKCIVYIREIANIEKHLSAVNAGAFVDLVPGEKCWNEEAKSRLQFVKNGICNEVDKSNVVKSTTELNGGGLNGERALEYIRCIGEHFFSTVKEIVDAKMVDDGITSDFLCHEVILHWQKVTKTHMPFLGREEFLNRIKTYLLTDTEQPLVITGLTGSGKTSVIAKAAYDINEAIKNSDLSMPTALITRVLGETQSTNNIQQLLYSICHQLAYVMGRYRQEIPNDYKSLKNYFIELVQKGEYGGMLVILLDGLDHLSYADNGHKLDWIPSRIAANVKVIASVSADNKGMAKRFENKADGNILCLQALSVSECGDIMKVLMGLNSRAVNESQWKLVRKAFSLCTYPLYVRLVFEETCKWASYENIVKQSLGFSVEEIVTGVFTKAEQEHGKVLMSRTLGYLTAAKDGFSETELEDILSLDDDVLNSLFITLSRYPSARRFPVAYWARLRQDLEPYLITKNIDGIGVITWRYGPFQEQAKARYLSEDDLETATIHSTIADYYLGVWSGTRKKPFRHPALMMARLKIPNSEDQACRCVQSQPLTFSGKNRYNQRKMSQMPFSLAQSKRYNDLKKHTVCNYDWLHTKLKATSVQHLLSDFNLYRDRETSLVEEALRMSKSALTLNPDALGMELTGRLLPYLNKYDNIKDMIRQCDLACQRNCPLVPNCQVYSAPGGPLQYECDVGGDIHCPIDIDVFTSPDGILLTAKPYYSNRLQVWELATGEERPDMMMPVGEVHPTRDGKHLNIFQNNKTIKTYKSDCGVLHGEVGFGPGTVADIEVSNKYVIFSVEKGAGPYVVDIQRSELSHKFAFHTHAVAISDEETYIAFNSERNILLFETPVMERKCVAQASDIAHDIIFIDESPKVYVLTKSKMIESINFDIINRKSKNKIVLTDLETKECIPSSSKQLMLIRCSKSIYLLDTKLDKVQRRITQLPPGVIVDTSTTFSGAGFTPADDMIVATRYTYLIIWQTESGEPVRVLQSTISPMIKLFTSSVNKVVTLLEDNSFQVWNLDNLDRENLHSNEVHPGAVRSFAISSDCQYLVSHDVISPEAKVLDMGDGKVIDTLQHSENQEDILLEVCLSPDGVYAVTRAILAQDIDQNANSTNFLSLRDDVMWEVEAATKVFHAANNRYVLFSPNSETAAFVTCAYYNKFDWSENLYHIFVVHPDTSSNRNVELPHNTEFVSKPCLARKHGTDYFVAVVQSCKNNESTESGTMKMRACEITLLVKNLASRSRQEVDLLRLENMATGIKTDDNFLDVVSIGNGNVLVTYAKGVEVYPFETNKGIARPPVVDKGAVILDTEKGEALKHLPSFLDRSSDVERFLLSSKFTTIVDSDLRVFNFETNTFITKIESVRLQNQSARLALDGRYVVALSENGRNIVIVRTSDGVEVGSVFVHGRASCLDVGNDDRTVVVGCLDGRVMIFSLILELADPVREHIEKLQSRNANVNKDEQEIIAKDIDRISVSTPDLQRLSARMRSVSSAESRRPPPYSTIAKAVTISRQSSRGRSGACAMQ